MAGHQLIKLALLGGAAYLVVKNLSAPKQKPCPVALDVPDDVELVAKPIDVDSMINTSPDNMISSAIAIVPMFL